MKWWILLLLLLSAQATSEVSHPPSIYIVDGGAIVCLAEPHKGKEYWQSACARLGQWMPCFETEKTLSCPQKGTLASIKP